MTLFFAKDVNWERSQLDYFENESAPFIPNQEYFNEVYDRNSIKGTDINQIIDNYQAKNTQNQSVVNIDYRNFEKVLKQDTSKQRPVFHGLNRSTTTEKEKQPPQNSSYVETSGKKERSNIMASLSKRRRHKYPLGDFKF